MWLREIRNVLAGIKENRKTGSVIARAKRRWSIVHARNPPGQRRTQRCRISRLCNGFGFINSRIKAMRCDAKALPREVPTPTRPRLTRVSRSLYWIVIPVAAVLKSRWLTGAYRPNHQVRATFAVWRKERGLSPCTERRQRCAHCQGNKRQWLETFGCQESPAINTSLKA